MHGHRNMASAGGKEMTSVTTCLSSCRDDEVEEKFSGSHSVELNILHQTPLERLMCTLTP